MIFQIRKKSQNGSSSRNGRRSDQQIQDSANKQPEFQGIENQDETGHSFNQNYDDNSGEKNMLPRIFIDPTT